MGHTIGGDGPGAWHALDAIVTEVVHARREIARLQAAEAQLLADAVDLVVARVAEQRARRRATDHDLPLREVAAELSAAMRVSDRTVQARMGDAATLASRLPATLTAWADGRIDQGHVAAILDAGAVLVDDYTRARFEERALAAAETETPARLRPIARALAAQLDPAGARERAARGHADRRVRLIDLGDDITRLLLDVPAVLGHAIFTRLTEYALAVKAASIEARPDIQREHGIADPDARPSDPATGDRTVVVTGPTDMDAGDEQVADPRTIDQLRADVVVDLLLSATATAHGDPLDAITAIVQVTIPVLTLAGTSDQPALLAGHGPIDPDTARRLAAGAPGWDRILVHPHTGAPLATDRYRPDAHLRRFLRARDERCRFPGCTRGARRCDIDHTIDAAKGGSTRACNLSHFCRRHHTLKHATAWTVRQRGGGVLEWTSPTGRRYLDRPPAVVRFVQTDWRALALAPLPGEPPPF